MRTHVMTFAAVLVCLFNSLSTSAFAQDIPAKDLTVKGQDKQRYFLIGDTAAKAPEAGFGLVLVMPGGDGSDQFHPFVKNIAAQAMPEGYLVVQLVAVPSSNPNQIVWPTAKLKDSKQTFTTESFIANVVKDVKDEQKVKVDPKRVFTLAWSSGGPAAYVASVAKDSPVTGSFIAMSVFRIADVKPLLKSAKGKPYYLYQSPQDQVTAYFFATSAKKQLTAAGATVELTDYDGGHGWHGDPFGNIRAGIDWLEEQVTKKTAEDSKTE